MGITKPHDDLVGRRLGQYRVIAPLGAGTSATVYRAETDDDTLVALKVSRPGLLRQRTPTARFLREVQAIRRLNHPGCVKIYDWGIEDERAFIAMELVEGRDLLDVIASAGRLSPLRATRIAIAVCNVLGAAHDLGVIHRDLKPRNIKLTTDPDGHDGVKLVDFGLAKILNLETDSEDDEHTDVETLTGPRAVLGTFRYMAPEQITRNQDIDGRADLFSLGVVLYQMLSGELPYAGRDALALRCLMDQPLTAPRPLSALVSDVDDDLESAVLRCIEPDPADRFQTAAALEEALTQLAPHLAVSAAGESEPPEPTQLYSRRVEVSSATIPVEEPTKKRVVRKPQEAAEKDQDANEEPTRTRTTKVLRRWRQRDDGPSIEIVIEETERLPPEALADETPEPSPVVIDWRNVALVLLLAIVAAAMAWQLRAG